jgi:predicted membrane chloride channel (bestrophin family)
VADTYPGDYLVPHKLLEEGIANMEGVAGVCERILASPIPPTYSRHLSRVLVIWLAALPIGLIGSGVPILGVVTSTAFTSYVLIGLDEIGMEIEHPFSLLPLQQLAGAVQNGVGMQLIDNECSDGSIPDKIVCEMPEVPL